MTRNQVYWYQPLQFWVMVGATLAVSAKQLATSPAAMAQRIPIADDTLGDERSIVTPDQVIRDVPSNRIDGGTRRGGNLFHSFAAFNIDAGRGAYFSNPAGVDNILARVTGNSQSDILGRLGILGDANLFLLNPNGIIFGADARLDIGGAFVASTADAIAFPSGEVFSATNPTLPTPLLNVDPNALLFNQLNPQPIINRSIADTTGLTAAPGQTLALVGGDVRLENGQLTALGGRVELGGLSAPGAIGLTMNGNRPRLAFPANVARSDVSLVTDSQINVAAGGGGSVAITTRNLNLNGESEINAGIGEGLGAAGSQAGDIEINATGAIGLVESTIFNNVRPESTGRGGNIRISTGSLSLIAGGRLGTFTFGEGDAGGIIIEARDTVSFAGSTADGRSSSGVRSGVAGEGIGRGGNIRISTGSLSLTAAGLDAFTAGRGDAGDIIIEARDTVFLRGGISNDVGSDGVGQGGNIRIRTGSLVVADTSAGLITDTSGRGDAGDIIIDARDTVFLDSGLISSDVSSGGVGQGGNIRIRTGSLTLRNSALLGSTTFGRGNGGNVIIEARDTVSIDDGGFTNGVSNGGNDVPTGSWRAGIIRITTGSLSLTNGAQLNSSTFGEGDAGDIIIEARDAVSFDGTGPGSRFSDDPGGRYSTGAFSNVERNSIGTGGNIRITTGSLSLTNGAQLAVSTYGRGDAGDIIIEARDTVSFDGTTEARSSLLFGGIVQNGRFRSGAFSTVEPGAIGAGGDITVIAPDLAITNGAELSASSSGSGSAGDIRINAPQVQLDQGNIASETRSGDGGNIDLTVPNTLLLRRGSFISTSAGRQQAGGDGGNITFNSGFILTVPSENSDITANAFTGSGGNVDITAQAIFGFESGSRLTPQSNITASSQFGTQGTIALNTPDVDPTQGLTELPADVTDASRQIAQACPTGGATANQVNEFIITGRGGLPPTPDEAINQDAIQVELVTAEAEPSALEQEPNQNRSPALPLVEAQGMQVAADGSVILVAAVPQSAIAPSPAHPAHCH